jgi:hypothetical protein
VRNFIGVSILTAICALSQSAAVPARWIGTWTLDVSRSTFASTGLTLVSQTLKIEQSGSEIRISGETVMADGRGTHTSRDDNKLSLDGKPTVVGPVSLSFRRIDDYTFEIVSQLDAKDRNVGEVSRFSFTVDGKTLTETKTQTERQVAPKGADKNSGAVLRASQFVLVFDRNPRR